jgi:DNA-binding MarR family transcriptional regulator
MHYPEKNTAVERIREHIQHHLEAAGTNSDTTGMELIALTHLVTQTYDEVNSQNGDHACPGLSHSRWKLLMHLWEDERRGKTTGLTPTALSRGHNVTKNTISALLRGLEEQGLVHRALDPIDHRIFRIQLTPEGRALATRMAPTFHTRTNYWASGLTLEERTLLCQLLEKLYQSLCEHTSPPGVEVESTLSSS